MTIKATINPRESDRIISHRKESAGLNHQISIIDRDTGREIVIARLYRPGNAAYACVWINYGNGQARGAGKAGGGGYCKGSAAIDSALSDAGVTLSESVHGRGMRAAREACEAVARAVTGKRKFFVVEAHT